MSSLPFISHHLFVAAASQENPGRQKSSRPDILRAGRSDNRSGVSVKRVKSANAPVESYRAALPMLVGQA